MNHAPEAPGWITAFYLSTEKRTFTHRRCGSQHEWIATCFASRSEVFRYIMVEWDAAENNCSLPPGSLAALVL